MVRSGTLLSFSALSILLAIAGAGPLKAQEPGPFKVDPLSAAHGKALWNSLQCEGCHELGTSRATGPALIGVTDRRSVEWLRKWLKDPVSMVTQDSTAAAMKAQYGSQMPNFGLTNRDVDGLINYLIQLTQNNGKSK